MDGLLAGRTAVITAAGSGMGRESALAFAREGAHVILMDIDSHAVKAVAAEITGAGGSASTITIDLTDSDELREAFAEIGSRHESLEILFNHAGRPGPYGVDFSEEDWDHAVNLNLKTPVLMTQLAVPLLRKAERGRASIIFTSSVSGLVASPASPVYSAVKGGVVLFMKAIAVALAPDGIRANAICPGLADTPMLREFIAPRGTATEHETVEDREARIEKYASRFIPLGRPAQPSEIASAALFLASSQSSYITGVALPVDGGYVAR